MQAIFFDIDGTILNSKGEVLESTKKAITQAQKKGIYCGIATGRGPLMIQQVTKAVDLDFCITFNGQLVQTREETIYERTFDKKTLQKLVAYAEREKKEVTFASRDQLAGSWTMRVGNRSIMRRLSHLFPNAISSKKINRVLKKMDWNQGSKRYSNLKILEEDIFQLVMLHDENDLLEIHHVIPECDVKRSNPVVVDIVPKGGSKIAGIQEFCRQKGIPIEETMAFGDHLNDLEMLQGVGIGVAMGNGKPEVKKIASYTTTSNDQDGIAKALQHFGIIEMEV